MKELTLVVLITLAFSVSCMAEGIEPNGLFGLSGAVWEPQTEEEGPNMGFYEGKAYSVTSDGICVHNMPGSYYIDLLFFSVIHIAFDNLVFGDGILSSLL